MVPSPALVGHAYSIFPGVWTSLLSVISPRCLRYLGGLFTWLPNSPFSRMLPGLTFKLEPWKPNSGLIFLLSVSKLIGFCLLHLISYLFPSCYHRLDLSTMACHLELSDRLLEICRIPQWLSTNNPHTIHRLYALCLLLGLVVIYPGSSF